MADDTTESGFGSMDETKHKAAARKGGRATAGKNLTKEARAKGGKNSHNGGRKSE